MNAEDIETRVAEIRRMAVDDEAAHVEEDRLRSDVLKAIAAGAPNAAELAAAALKTGEIEFSRWYA